MDKQSAFAGRQHTLPADIERTSMAIINEELEALGIEICEENLPVVKRVIHTTADFDYARNLHFTPHAVERAKAVLAAGNATIVTDTNMAFSGVSKPALAKLGAQAHCYMAEDSIKVQAKELGVTRAVASVMRASQEHPQAIFAVGNAPTALLALADLMRDGLRPSLIIGAPVGFVNVVEAKELIFELCQELDVPAIVAFGRKGGSNVAAAICNALAYGAADMLDPTARGWQG